MNVGTTPPRMRIEELAKNPRYLECLGKLQERIRLQQAKDRAEEVEALPG